MKNKWNQIDQKFNIKKNSVIILFKDLRSMLKVLVTLTSKDKEIKAQ